MCGGLAVVVQAAPALLVAQALLVVHCHACHCGAAPNTTALRREQTGPGHASSLHATHARTFDGGKGARATAVGNVVQALSLFVGRANIALRVPEVSYGNPHALVKICHALHLWVANHEVGLLGSPIGLLRLRDKLMC